MSKTLRIKTYIKRDPQTKPINPQKCIERNTVCCSVLQYASMGCSALQCVAVYGTVLQCVAVRCSTISLSRETHDAR